MQDLQAKEHVIEVLSTEIDDRTGRSGTCLTPPVVNPNKDKPHTVFDCAPQHLRVSLNSKVLQGPDLTNSSGANQVPPPPDRPDGRHRSDVPPGTSKDVQLRRTTTLPVVALLNDSHNLTI